MELWKGRLTDFVQAAASGAIVGEMIRQFYNFRQFQPDSPEVNSWKNSLHAMAVVVQSQRGDLGVIVEYHLPLSGRRIDVMLVGVNKSGVPHAVIVELKQWSEVRLEDEFALNVTVGGVEHPHPCQQALDYAEYLEEVHGSFVGEQIVDTPCAYCHNITSPYATVLEDDRFKQLLARSPLFKKNEEQSFSRFIGDRIGFGSGLKAMDHISLGRFKPSKKVLNCLDAVLRDEEQWHLLDSQRKAYNAILAEAKRRSSRQGQSAILIRGGPGTGKTVIAVQLLADALRLGFTAAHSTGGKAFFMALRSKFKGADKLFIWNMHTKNYPSQGIDLLLVDEAHRIRETSDTHWTRKGQRAKCPQTDELMNAAKVTVFFLDEHQYIRPDEIGETDLIRKATARLKLPLKEYDLDTQFRCNGCLEYIQWVDYLLGFGQLPSTPWDDHYQFEIADKPEDLDSLMEKARMSGETSRIVAGFCWRWSNQLVDGSLADDVVIDGWSRPWNEKANQKKSYRPENHPYTKWAETENGYKQVGCIYSVQGFEFDRVGVIWGRDLVWRKETWIAQKNESFDNPVKRSDVMLQLVRNAYRVLLTRGIRGTRLLCLDEETRQHVIETLKRKP
jgi:uncharacterized protein